MAAAGAFSLAAGLVDTGPGRGREQPNVLFTSATTPTRTLERLAEDGNFEPMPEKVSATKQLTGAWPVLRAAELRAGNW